MPAAKYVIKVEQGAYWSRLMTYKDQAGDPIDLTGYSAAMMVRSLIESTSTILSLTSDDGITLGGDAGTIFIEITTAQSAALPPGDAVYDLELTGPSGEVERLLQGPFIVSPEVTR